jgi:hypothetical protein
MNTKEGHKNRGNVMEQEERDGLCNCKCEQHGLDLVDETALSHTQHGRDILGSQHHNGL